MIKYIIVFIIPFILNAQEYTITSKIDNERIRISIYVKEFIPYKHKIEFRNAMTFIDDMKVYGVAPEGIPAEEIENFKIEWNDIIISLPQKYYIDCYNPTFDSSNVRIDIGYNKNQILFFMNGSDGAGVYSVLWIIDKNENHNRYVIFGGDCHLFNLYCGDETSAKTSIKIKNIKP